MKYSVIIAAAAPLALCVVVGSLATGGRSAVLLQAAEKAGAATAAKPPPLKVDRGAPLLLDDSRPGDKPKEPRLVADNESCFVCHGDFRDEPLAKSHSQVNVGCIKCHGASSAHRDDEDNITPPDIMFAKEQIDKACKECHDDHDVSPRKVIARWQERCPQKTNPADILCVDCHGAHHRPFRTVQWDKHTHKLLVKLDKAAHPTSPKAAAASEEEMK